MGQDLLSGILSISIVLLNPSSTPSAELTSQPIVQEEMRDYAVKEGDALTKIADAEYGNKEFWTSIWNDNDWIQNPDLIEKGWKLKIQTRKPETPVELKAELREKLIPPPISQISLTTTTPTPQITYSGGPLNEAQINFLGNCESGMSASRNSGNGYFGAFQFSPGTWESMGTEYARADLAPLEVQIDAVQRLVARSGIYTQFPGCSSRMRASGLL